MSFGTISIIKRTGNLVEYHHPKLPNGTDDLGNSVNLASMIALILHYLVFS